MIRFVNEKDYLDLQKVYAEYIETPITFDYEMPTQKTSDDKVKRISTDYPYLTAEENGHVVGFACAHQFMDKPAYQWGAELTIYISKTSVSKGLGRKMYKILMDILKLQGVCTVYGCVTIPNEKSERLHKALGFKQNALFTNAGYKSDKWQNVAWFEKQIGEYTEKPVPIKSIKDIPEDKLKAILLKYNAQKCVE